MSLKTLDLKLALILTLTLTGSSACNTQKAEQAAEDEAATETTSEAAPTRDNRSSQSGDAAFIKIFPDGEVIPTRGESSTVSAPPAANPATSTSGSAPATESSSNPAAGSSTESSDQGTASPTGDSSGSSDLPTAPETTSGTTPPTSSGSSAQPAPEATAGTTSPASEPAGTEQGSGSAQPAPEPVIVQEPAPASTPEPIVAHEPAPAPAEEAAKGELDDASRPALAVNEHTASTLISVLPKENKAIVAIGKHSDFVQGPYMILAKWNSDSKKVKVNVTSEDAKEKNCAINEAAAQGEWKPLGVFYLTKNAKVVITNGKNSNYAVKNELLLKPVIAENLTKPSKFKCLGGQIDGQGLVAFP